MKSYLPQKRILFLNTKTMLTNREHVTLQLLGNKVGFFQQKGEIETGTRNIEPLVDRLSSCCQT